MQGFDYTTLHWADKQKPLQEVAGEFGIFPETIESPPLVPEEIDEEAPLPAEEVALVERVTVSEHFMVAEYISVRPPERRAQPRERVAELAA